MASIDEMVFNLVFDYLDKTYAPVQIGEHTFSYSDVLSGNYSTGKILDEVSDEIIELLKTRLGEPNV